MLKIIIEPYNPEWEVKFEKEAQLLLDTINEDLVRIEHIGSTSIKGLGAKPIIDIMIGINDFNYADDHISGIEKLNYQYISKYEDIMPQRRFFIKESAGKRTHHIHMVQYASSFWKRHLFFRDHLRTNKNDRDAYEQLKRELSRKEWNDGNEYADAKSDFIKNIELKRVD